MRCNFVLSCGHVFVLWVCVVIRRKAVQCQQLSLPLHNRQLRLRSAPLSASPLRLEIFKAVPSAGGLDSHGSVDSNGVGRAFRRRQVRGVRCCRVDSLEALCVVTLWSFLVIRLLLRLFGPFITNRIALMIRLAKSATVSNSSRLKPPYVGVTADSVIHLFLPFFN